MSQPKAVSDTPSFGLAALVNRSADTTQLFEGQFCGGTVVGPQQVVTASHCVAGRSARTTDVVLGVTDLCAPEVTDLQRLTVRRIVAAPGGVEALALLELSADIVGPQPAVADHVPATGERLMAVGWGRQSFAGVAPCRARTLDLVALDNARCARLLGELGDGGRDQPGVVCAGAASGSGNSCDGDSGGPVLVRKGQEVELVAVTMSGDSCDAAGVGLNVALPGVR